MNFEEQIIAEGEKLLIEELQLLGVRAGGLVDKIPQTNNYISIYLLQLLKLKIIAHKVFNKIPQMYDCNNKIVAHKLRKKVD